MQDQNPILSQNLFGGKGGALPADVQSRLNKGELLPRDAEPLERAGYAEYARQCKELGAKVDDMRLNQEAENSRKAFIESQKQLHQWQNMPLAVRMQANPLNPRAVEQARREWGITES